MTSAGKAELRREMIARRAALSESMARTAAVLVAANALPYLEDARIVAIYAAIPGRGELDPAPLASALAAKGVILVYPRTRSRGEPLDFHRAATGELTPGTFGVPEPIPGAPLVPLDEIDAFVVPLLAVDGRGGRVGWGAGHYDRTLPLAPRALRLGVAFACQRLPSVPIEATDAPLDVVVTEDGALPTGNERQRRLG
jgi:5-formyltetrahydrofolate cyclo-ligase